ncbi:Phage-related tail protein [hydrothermal vent metagenome]|uniref:Phage-related tail protein n=1 Tax=hydrothermal vent metagenome TaxID=652676 RepID=A0A1W1CVG7_9ZZZZ
MKIIKKITIVLIIIIAGFVIFRDNLLKTFVEQQGSSLLNTALVIEEFNSDLLERTLNIKNIHIANLIGFQDKDAFTLNNIHLEINKKGKTIIVEKLNINNISLYLEQKNNRVNLYEIYNYLDNKHKSKQETSDDKKPTKHSTNKKEEYIVLIKYLSITNMNVRINSELIKEKIQIPDIIIYDLKAPLSKVSAKLMKIILDKMKKNIQKAGIDFGKKELKKTVIKKLKEKVNELIGDDAKKILKGFGLGF